MIEDREREQRTGYEHRERLQRAITHYRAHGGLRGWVLSRCTNDRCAVAEINLFVAESRQSLPFQPPLRCPRCQRELDFDGLDPEDAR